MNIEMNTVQGWTMLRFPDRVDALNIIDFMKAVETQVETQDRVAFDMRQVQFINFQALRYLHEVAIELNGRGGQVSLVGPSEKMKRQFTLFASLEPFKVISSFEWSRSSTSATPS